jgi:dTDP-L-rhamnose 4-epimerase
MTDVARVNALALAGAVDGRPGAGRIAAVNVCSGEPHTVGDLAATLATAMGGPAPDMVGGARAGDVRRVVADPAKARKLLGFTAEVSFADRVAAFATDEPAGVAG